LYRFQNIIATAKEYRFQNIIATAKEANVNMLTKGQFADAMKLHLMIELGASMYADESYTFVDLCTFAVGTWTGSLAPYAAV
jgi:hypothetical protein